MCPSLAEGCVASHIFSPVSLSLSLTVLSNSRLFILMSQLCKSNTSTLSPNSSRCVAAAGFQDVWGRLCRFLGWLHNSTEGEALCPSKWNSMNIWSAVGTPTAPTSTHQNTQRGCPLPPSVNPRTPHNVVISHKSTQLSAYT